MYDARDLLSETFEAHEHLVPDTADIMTKVDAIARTRRRNRWVLRATGVSLVSAGVIVGGFAAPSLFAHNGGHGPSRSVLAIEPGSQPSGGGSSYTQSQELAAYFEGGYGYADAQQLARLWHSSASDLTTVKAEAGLKLLEGQTLPVQPDSAPATPENKAVLTFFNAGYDYNDAVKLAAMWHDTDAYAAKVQGGKKLEAGEPLPIPPSGTATDGTGSTPASAAKERRLAQRKGVERLLHVRLAGSAHDAAPADGSDTSGMTPALTAYFDAGYDYNDAQKLAQTWHETDIDQVKAEAGQKLLDHDTLPVAPSGTPASPQTKAVDAFFAAGYDYNDAVKLGKMWNESDLLQVKAEAGQKLENGQTLPIPPSN